VARPKKETVDYFPHFTNSGKTLFILEGEFGNDGYAFWFKLLELLGSSDGHVYDCRNTPSWKFLLAKTKVDGDTATKILDTLSELEAIDQDLWKYNLIWSDNYVDNLQPVYNNRKASLPEKPIITSSNNNPDELLQVETDDKEVTIIKNRQSRVKESKLKETIEEETEKDPVGSSRPDEKLILLVKAYEQNGFGQLSEIVRDKLVALLNEYDFTWINEAFKIAVENNKRTLKYVEGILRNWRAEGGMKTETIGVKKSPPTPRKKTRFHNLESRTDKYSADDLENIAKRKREEWKKKQKEAGGRG